jgi:hypothetical protein
MWSGRLASVVGAVLSACGGQVERVPDVSQPCESLEGLGDCGTVTLAVDEHVPDPCSWTIGLPVQRSDHVSVALDCRLVASGPACWQIAIEPERALFVLRFVRGCCERLEAGHAARVDIGVQCGTLE